METSEWIFVEEKEESIANISSKTLADSKDCSEQGDGSPKAIKIKKKVSFSNDKIEIIDVESYKKYNKLDFAENDFSSQNFYIVKHPVNISKDATSHSHCIIF